jgi:hypothetical protein
MAVLVRQPGGPGPDSAGSCDHLAVAGAAAELAHGSVVAGTATAVRSGDPAGAVLHNDGVQGLVDREAWLEPVGAALVELGAGEGGNLSLQQVLEATPDDLGDQGDEPSALSLKSAGSSRLCHSAIHAARSTERCEEHDPAQTRQIVGFQPKDAVFLQGISGNAC